MKKFLALFLSVLMALGGVAWAEEAPVLEEAPVSQAFLDWQPPKQKKKTQETTVRSPEALRSGATSGSEDEDDEPFFGLIPSPVDRSHLNTGSKEISIPAGTLAPSYVPLRSGGFSPVGASATDTSYTEKTYVTDVRNQKSYGTCWAHAALAGVESYAKKQGTTLSLSPLHMAWFVYKDPDSGEAFGAYSTSKGILDQGGNADQAIAFMSRMVGPTLEENLPYDNATGASTVSGVLAQPENYTQARRLTDALQLGTVAQGGSSLIKQMILTYGAVQVSYYSKGQTTASSSADGVYNGSGDTYCYYDTSGGTDTNHAVVIVGWNDNFSKDNFNPKPSGNGAWLVKNSWDTVWGNSGYFWMSYYQYLTNATVYVTAAVEEVNTYSYDALGHIGTKGYDNTTAWAANVFQARGDETLTQVGFHTTDSGTKYTVSIYTGQDSPTGGTLQPDATTIGTAEYAGYHTVNLENVVSLSSDQHFSVVVKFENSSTAALPIAVEKKANWSTGNPYANPSFSGKSYISPDGSSWKKLTDADACIKAFTEDTGKDFKISTGTTLPNGIVDVAYSTTLTTRNATGSVLWTQLSGTLPPGLSLDPTAGVISGTPTATGTYSFTISATDGGSDKTVSKTFTVTIAEAGIAPSITTSSLISGTVGSKYSVTLAAFGTAPITWTKTSGTLPTGLSLSSSGVISGTPTKAGTYSFTVQAKNNFGVALKTYSLVIGSGTKPSITTTSLPAATIGKGYSAAIAATGNPTPTVTVSGLPAGLKYASGVISGTPTKCGTFTVKVTAKNSKGTVTKSLKLVVNAVKPSITTTSLPAATIGKGYSAAITVTGNPTPTVTASGLPAGLKYASGKISGTPTKCGTFTVKITAKNAGATITKSLKLVVNAVNPVISTSALPAGTIGKGYSAAVSVTGNPAPTVTASGLPAGLRYASGKISGTPTKCGTFTVTFTAKNAGATVTKSLKLVINAVNPVISTSSLAIGTIGKSYNATITVTGNPKPTVMASGLPAGLKCASGKISGTPTVCGTFTVTVTATNVGATVTKTLSLKVNAVKPAISTSSLAVATIGKSYSAAIAATGKPAPTVTVSNLPSGLSYNTSSKKISGTPTAAGTFTVSVQASNAGGTVTKSLKLKVNAVKPAISTSSLAAATVGKSYSASIAATGNPAPTVSVSGLPSGLSFNTSTKKISGTPTKSGTFTVKVTVSNAGGAVTKSLKLKVAAAKVNLAGLDDTDGVDDREEGEDTETVVLIPDANQDRADLKCVSGDVVLGVVRARPGEALAFQVGVWRDIAGNVIMVTDLAVCVDGEPVEAKVDADGVFTLPGFDGDGEYAVSVMAGSFGQMLKSREVIVSVGEVSLAAASQTADGGGSGCDAGFGALSFVVAAVLLSLNMWVRKAK